MEGLYEEKYESVSCLELACDQEWPYNNGSGSGRVRVRRGLLTPTQSRCFTTCAMGSRFIRYIPFHLLGKSWVAYSRSTANALDIIEAFVLEKVKVLLVWRARRQDKTGLAERRCCFSRKSLAGIRRIKVWLPSDSSSQKYLQ